MKYLLIALLLTTTQLHAQTNNEKAVTAAVEQLRQLMITPDSSALVKLVSNDLSYGHSSGLVEDKAAFIKSLVSGSSDFVSMNLSNQTVQVLGETAIVRHLLEGEINANNATSKVKLHILLVWQKKKEGWQLVARHAARAA
ncbi:nuclear transport factor 2 family protein [Paracnuella aquatica]|uniref:nuclear transport factor 2 family protein n=1 Tax=Paracnuella aquatica TaxID=2268757 RepID=UPI000DEFCC46|nr:nuclear transport factor 2 family protein [Paracnuella aquatica]RPD50923.1 nuclear transport factor 2 family protein [Paracnuella aquatica]